MANHQQLIQQAIVEAQLGKDLNEGPPFGALIVQNGTLLIKGHDQTIITHDLTARAVIQVDKIKQKNIIQKRKNMVAIRLAGHHFQKQSFEDCELYLSSEPCPIEQAAIFLGQFRAVYYAASARELYDVYPQEYALNVVYQNDLAKEPERRGTPSFQIQSRDILQLFIGVPTIRRDWVDSLHEIQEQQMQEKELELQRQQYQTGTHHKTEMIEQYDNFDKFVPQCMDDNVNVLNNAHLDSQNQLQHGAPHPQFGGITRSDLIKPISPGVGLPLGRLDQYETTFKISNTTITLKNTNKIDLKLFVGQIPKKWTDREVTQHFEKYGEILESQIIRDNKTGQHKGCAFVKFTSMTVAERAMEHEHGTTIENADLRIKWADGESERLGVEPGKTPKLFIGSLPKECSEVYWFSKQNMYTQESLREVFEFFGPIDELHLNRDQDNRSKGTAIIRYERTESALLAIRNFNAVAYLEHSDRPMEVRFAERKDNRNVTVQEAPVQQHHVVHQAQQIQQQTQNQSLYYTKYYDEQNRPYYYRWQTQKSQYEVPPPGSVVWNQEHSKCEVVEGGGPSLNDIPSSANKTPGPVGANLFIFHLPSDYKDSDLKALFAPYGNVISARVITQQDGRSKGFGFVSYDDAASAKKAIHNLNAKKLLVKIKEGEDHQQKYMTALSQSKFSVV